MGTLVEIAFHANNRGNLIRDVGVMRIQNMLDRGWITISQSSFPAKSVPPRRNTKAAAEWAALKYHPRESDQHRRIKFSASAWLRSNGAKTVEYEVRYDWCGFKPDVVSEDKKTIVECGDTEPDRIISVFNEDVVFVNVPYADRFETKYEAFIFRSTPYGIEEFKKRSVGYPGMK